jgi:hypothetical protein
VVAIAVATIVAVVPVLIGAGVVLLAGDDTEEVRTVVGSPLTLPPLGIGDPLEIPIATAGTEIGAWTGDELVLFGDPSTQQPSTGNAGVVFAPATGEWREISSTPYPEPLEFVDGVWTGEELVIGGTRCENRTFEGAEEHHCFPGELAFLAYDPADDRWRELGRPEELVFPPDNDGTWGEVLGFAGGQVVVRSADRFWSLDVEQGGWRQLADHPFEIYAEYCVSSDRLVAVSGGLQLATLDLASGSWSFGPPIDAVLVEFELPELVCSPTTPLVFAQTLSRAWTFDVVDARWTELPPAADVLPAGESVGGLPPFPSSFASATLGRVFLFTDSDKATVGYDPDQGTWFEAAPFQVGGTPFESQQITWADGYAFASFYGLERDALVTYRPLE